MPKREWIVNTFMAIKLPSESSDDLAPSPVVIVDSTRHDLGRKVLLVQLADICGKLPYFSGMLLFN